MSTCPATDDLERYIAEECEPAQGRLIAEHIAVCERCSTWLERARDDGIFADQIRAAVEQPERTGASTEQTAPPAPDRPLICVEGYLSKSFTVGMAMFLPDRTDVTGPAGPGPAKPYTVKTKQE